MNLVNRIFTSIGLVVLLAGFVSAQESPRTKPGVSKTSIAPASNTPTPRNTTSTPRAAERSAAMNRTIGRPTTTTTTTTKVVDRSTTEGRLMPSPTNLRNSTARPAYSNTRSGVKTVSKAAQKAPVLKPVEKVNVNWMTLDQAIEQCKVEKRKIFVDVYTDWCGWCKHMDSTTFVNPAVARYLNEHYYPVKFNAEQSQDIVFKDKTYHFKKNGSRGYHELAALWLNNRLSFPTVVFLDESQNLIQPVPGYQDATKMEAIINYFGSDSHRKTPWETYEKNFSSQGK